MNAEMTIATSAAYLQRLAARILTHECHAKGCAGMACLSCPFATILTAAGDYTHTVLNIEAGA